MTKRKKTEPKEKHPVEMTNEELAKHVFGEHLKQHLDEIAHKDEPKPDRDASSQN